MPAQQGVRRGDRGDLAQCGPAHSVGSGSEAPTVRIREPESTPAELSTQELVLFDKVRDRLPFRAFQPAGQSHQEQLHGGEVEHEAELIS